MYTYTKVNRASGRSARKAATSGGVLVREKRAFVAPKKGNLPSISIWASQSSQLFETLAMDGPHEPLALNERAVRVIDRVDNKLTGREFGEELSVSQQVHSLIEQATSNQNLCQSYVGWCPFW